MVSLEEHYRALFRKYGDTPRAVQYRDRPTQEKRFEVLVEVADLAGCLVLDFGCGTGHLADYLEARGIHVRYTGVDLVQEMLDCAQAKHPGHRFLRPEALGDESWDWILISGVFNNRIADNRAFYRDVLRTWWPRAQRGMAFNMLSSYVDFEAEHLFYEDPAEVFRFAKAELTPFITLRNDYQIKPDVIPFEFTVYLYRKRYTRRGG